VHVVPHADDALVILQILLQSVTALVADTHEYLAILISQLDTSCTGAPVSVPVDDFLNLSGVECVRPQVVSIQMLVLNLLTIHKCEVEPLIGSVLNRTNRIVIRHLLRPLDRHFSARADRDLILIHHKTLSCLLE